MYFHIRQFLLSTYILKDSGPRSINITRELIKKSNSQTVSHLLNQKLWRWSPEIRMSINPPGDSDVQ